MDQIYDIFLNSQVNSPFAFIELSTDDMATALIQQAEEGSCDFRSAQGILFKLKIKRPNKYRPMNRIDPRKVMVLGLPSPAESEPVLRELFATFGDVDVFAIVPQRGCYVEFQKESAAANAVKTLHGEVLGDRIMVVQFVTECMRFTFASLGLPVSGIEDDMVEEILDPEKEAIKMLFSLNHTLPQALQQYVQTVDHLKQFWPLLNPTRILVLLNIVDVDELEEDKDFYNLLTDIATEAEKHGRVKEIIIPRTPPKPPVAPTLEDLPPKPAAPAFADDEAAEEHRAAVAHWEEETKRINDANTSKEEDFRKAREEWDQLYWHPVRGALAMGRVFVEYLTADEAAVAQQAIAGRLFNGRTVITSFLFEDIMYPPATPEAGVDEMGRALMITAAPEDVVPAVAQTAPSPTASIPPPPPATTSGTTADIDE